jgi:hypothetical protein
VKTLNDLLAFIDLVLTTGFDVAAAQERLGTIERWTGELGRVESADPALRDSVIETLGGALCGVQTYLVSPLEIPWEELKKALGEPEEHVFMVDNFSGQVTYRFQREVKGSRGVVYLYAVSGQDPARIELVVVRPEKSSAPAGG